MRATLTFAVLLGAASVSIPARAQDSREEARREFEEAERQFRAGNHQLALGGFMRSRELVADDPRASALILFNVARAHEELGHYRDALEAFERYLVDSPADAPFRQDTQDRVRELRARMSASAERSETSNQADPFPLIGGIVLAVGGLAAVAAVPSGVLALDGTTQLEDLCASGDCPASEAARIDAVRTLGIATDVLWVSGLSIAAIGATLLGLGLAEDGVEGGRVTVTPSILCATHGCVASVRLGI